MVMDSLRAYVQLATGLTEVTVNRAREVARQLMDQGLDLERAGADARHAARQFQDQVSGLADDLMAQGKANREALIETISEEVDKAVGRLGFVREEELAALRAHVMRLEAQIARMSPAAPAKRARSAASTSTAKAKKAAATRTRTTSPRTTSPRTTKG